MYYEKLSSLGIRLRKRAGQEKTTCPQCSESRRNKKDPCLSVNITEGAYQCHNCGWKGNVKSFARKEDRREFAKPDQNMLKSAVLTEKIATWFQKRGISKQTLEKFFIHGKKEFMPQTGAEESCIVFPYLRDGVIVNAKMRDGRKNFKMVKDAELIFFGMQTLQGRHCAIIHEGECFHPDAEVLTKKGWVKFSEYNNEFVAQYTENGKIEFVKPILEIIKRFDGELIEYSNQQKFYSLTTPSHNLVFNYNGNFVKRIANDMPNDAMYKIPRVAFHNGNGINLTDNEIRLCIAVSADFSLRKEGDLYCRLKKDRKATRLKEILNSLNIKYSCNIDSKGYYSFFIRRGNNPGYLFKEFPHEWIYKSTQKQKKLIIDEILYWDGNSVPNRNQIEYSTKLYSNATFIQTISSLCGYCATIIPRSSELGKWYKVSILFSKQNTTSLGLNKNKRNVKYNGLVYCLTVPSGMLFVRQNGCISVSGNCDALASYEAGFGQEYEPMPDAEGEVVEHELGRWSVLSVPNGASKGNQRLEYLDNCAEWLADIDEFIIATDNDEPGKQLKDELVRRLGVEKCRILDWSLLKTFAPLPGKEHYPCKDANEVLVTYGPEAVQKLMLSSAAIPVDGIYSVQDIFDTMIENFRKGVQLAPTTRFTEMDEYFRWKKGDITLVTGYGNAGKSFFLLQLMLTKSIWDGWKWAIFSPENYPANDFYDDIIEMYAGKWLDKMTEDEYVAAANFINEHIFFVYPENEHDINSIHEKFRYLILKKGVDGVLVDPWNQLDKTQRPYERDDQYLSVALKDVKRFALLNHVAYCIIAHPKNPSYNQDRSLPVPDVYDLHGGSMWANKCDQILAYYRPRFHEDKNSPEVDVYVQKLKRKRTGGKLGNFPLFLDWGKKRYSHPVSGETPCDPVLAAKSKLQLENNYEQQKINLEYSKQDNNFESRTKFLPYKDPDSDEEIGF